MNLASIINPELVVYGLEGGSREEVYGKLVDHVLKRVSLDKSRDEILRELIGREDSIKIPYESIALPHMRDAAFSDLHIAIGVLERPLKLKDNDFGETKIIILSLISQKTSDTYLKALAAFSKYLSKPVNQEKLIKAGSSEAALRLLEEDKVKLKKEITAEDVMNSKFTSVTADAPLSEALDIFTREKVDQLPVVDGNGILKGIIDGTHIIRKHIPEYVLMMNNLKFLTSFEPFDNIFKDEVSLKVKDFMQEAVAVISPETPLIQLTVSLVKKEAPNLYVVTDSERRLVGIITVQQIIHKILRG